MMGLKEENAVEMNKNEIPCTKSPSISIKKYIFVHALHSMCQKVVGRGIINVHFLIIYNRQNKLYINNKTKCTLVFYNSSF